ncbi:MAG: SpoIIE family protein phosphatase [Mariprofundaceae bacterium]|nr:SpoIIE family protein phosphatase [Mariprofundaceae bacterium]
MNTTSIRQRVKRAIIYASAITMLVFLLVMGFDRLDRMDTMMKKKSTYIANLVQTSLPIPVWNMDDKSTNDILDAVFLDTDVVYIAVMEEGQRLEHRVQEKYSAKDFAYFENSRSFTAVSTMILYDDKTIATVNIAISNKRLKTEIYKDMGYIFVLTLLLIVVITSRMFVTMRSSIFTPLKELEDAVTLISDGNLNEPIAKRSDDEIGRLGDACESMRESIKTLICELSDANEGLEEKVKARTIALENAHQSIKSSIEYASLIQGALIPEEALFRQYFSDFFALWLPKDVVGGDIYLFNTLGNPDECLLMVIDCTGHGVAGAFVTMLVKAIEQQIIEDIIHRKESVSPAKVLLIFNQTMKHLLKQNDKNAVSNAGFDGGIVYFNKKEGVIKFAGAETSLCYIEDGVFKTIKGSRHSVGYKRSDPDFEFNEYTFKAKKGMRLYLSTDGYLDQSGGEKGFCLGRKKFQQAIESIQHEPMHKHQALLISALESHQGEYERNDDVAVVGLEV